MVQAGTVLIGIMGTLSVALPVIPALWFPPQHRVTITGKIHWRLTGFLVAP